MLWMTNATTLQHIRTALLLDSLPVGVRSPLAIWAASTCNSHSPTASAAPAASVWRIYRTRAPTLVLQHSSTLRVR